MKVVKLLFHTTIKGILPLSDVTILVLSYKCCMEIMS